MTKSHDRQQDAPCSAGHRMPRLGCEPCLAVAPRKRKTEGPGPCAAGHARPKFGCEACIELASVQHGNDVVRRGGRFWWRK